MTNTIVINRINSNKFSIPLTPEVLRLVDDYFHYYTNEGIKTILYDFSVVGVDRVITLGSGFYEQLVKLLLMNGYGVVTDDEIPPKSYQLDIIDKWKEILDSDYRVVEGKNQYEYLSELIQYNRACGQLFTGFGKSELLLAITESYLIQNPEKNAVILVPDNTIKNEFIERSNKWDLVVKPEYHKFKDRLQLINPIGLNKSKKYKSNDPSLVDYFKNVGLVIIDEVHHLPANTYLHLLDTHLINYDFIYGVSGTVDSGEGYVPKLKDTPNDVSGRLNRIISYLGPPRVDVKNPTPILISYLRVDSTRVPKVVKSNYMRSVQIFFNSPNLITSVVNFLKKNPTRRMFLPIIKVEQGRKLVERFEKELGKGSCVFKSGAGIYPSAEDLGFESLKDYLSNSDKFRLIVGTTAMYEGFDSDMINTILLGVGSSQRMTIQPTGRGTRSDDIPMVLLPWDINGSNTIVNKQTRTRYDTLKREFKNYKFVSLE